MSELTVAAIQTDPVFGDLSGNLEAALALVPPGCDLAVLPELCTSGYQFVSREEALSLAEPVPGGPSCRRLLAFAAERKVTVVAGLPELVRGGSSATGGAARPGGPAGDDARCYNSAVLCRPDGTWGLYRKVHLFWDEKLWFAPGDLGFPVFRACGTALGVMICFDWIFPEAARSLALAGAAVICHPSNLVLPHCPDAMITRCLENRVHAITANRVGAESRTDQPLHFIGQSQVVSPRGEVLAACAGAGAGVAAARIDPDATDKRITPRNDLFADRRPESYHL